MLFIFKPTDYRGSDRSCNFVIPTQDYDYVMFGNPFVNICKSNKILDSFFNGLVLDPRRHNKWQFAAFYLSHYAGVVNRVVPLAAFVTSAHGMPAPLLDELI